MKALLGLLAATAAVVLASDPASANLDAECETRFSTRNTDEGVPVFRTEVYCESGGGGFSPADDWWWIWMFGNDASAGGGGSPPDEGGGGGGSDPMSEQRTTAIINRTVVIARQRLRDLPACRFHLLGSSGDALEVLDSLVAEDRIRAGGIIDFNSEHPNPNTAGKVSGLGLGRSGTIWLYGPFFGTNLMAGGPAIYHENERARALLHELGHLTANPGCSPAPPCIPILDPYRHTDDPATEGAYDDRIRADCGL
jgi:hypothetical protein